ncbi:hypothetical protein SUBVAR_07150 [Subdoligranulum variabile DSM 15176]|uniref:DNA mismatch endonuclease Vsr n=1 Tax=Subdoligranulum variabile DSM 15176 TaxID=411471 RepID=D1PRW7_9FIRM|nr:hypothetical protein SUBVAR_07150 [Subdoligranulum variabile DSM 15176]
MNSQLLTEIGWKVLTVWECELKKKVRDDRLAKLEQEIKGQNGEV